MIDRRRNGIRINTLTLGAVFFVMGLYAFSPLDTLFTATLARLEIEEMWGSFMIAAGALLAFSATGHRRYVRWLGNTAGMLMGGLTFWICWSEALLTPTGAAMGVIAVGCLASMIRDAFAGQNYRCWLRQTGQWESGRGG